MFGATYQFVTPPIKAVPGEYDVTLTKVTERNLKGYGVLTFDFVYQDGKKRVPDSFDVFDVTDTSNEVQKRAFNIKMSKIALCFGLSGNFNEETYRSWEGKIGRIVITRTQDGFLTVSDFIPKEEAK
jgi:hypothetical protein